MFSKILIANRGEIAARVIRTAKSLGYRTVAVYSEADAGARHVREADQAVLIGPSPVGQSYLSIERIIDACRRSGADAVHPGYGFLSENMAFAAACEAAGIVFIGPPAPAVELMGSKRLSKIAMQAAGVPTIPGYEGADQSDETLIREARRVGFPLMVKASAGGGGRGMRLVFEEAQLAEQIRSARSEAENAFGSGELILERAIIEPRHIEIQVFADQHGNVIHLGERDCSVQRRHQKVVEESPSPFMVPELRAKMGEAAVAAARSCNYVGAGTVEFLVDKHRSFYFLEMNTRLQVEHPVTELVTGTDLVEWQIRVAAGEKLPMSQEQVTLTGHAIEVRLYAEEPALNFMPQTGPVLMWKAPERPGLRIDHGMVTGYEISPFYDPMVAKVITYGQTRDDARRRLITGVEDTVLLGLNSNKAFLTSILRHPAFAAGEATTAFIDQHLGDEPSLHPFKPGALELGLAAAIRYLQQGAKIAHRPGLAGWRNAQRQLNRYRFELGEETLEVSLKVAGNLENQLSFTVSTASGESLAIDRITLDGERCHYQLNGVLNRLHYFIRDREIYLDTARGNLKLIDRTLKEPEEADLAGSGKIAAPLDGTVIAVNVKPGDRVAKGDIVVVLDAMKMEHQLRSDVNGVVAAVSVSERAQVKIRQILAEVTPDEE